MKKIILSLATFFCFHANSTELVVASGLQNADGISVTAEGTIYISGGLDEKNIIKVNDDGSLKIIADAFESTNGMDIDSKGNIIVADYHAGAIYRVTPQGNKTTLAKELDGPAGIWVDDNDNVVVGLFGANYSGKGAKVIQIDITGNVQTIAESQGLSDVIGVSGDNDGNYFAVQWGAGEVFKIREGKVQLLRKTGLNLNMIDYFRGEIFLPGSKTGKIYSVNANSGEMNEIVLRPLDKTLLQKINAIRVDRNNCELIILDSGSGTVFRHDICDSN